MKLYNTLLTLINFLLILYANIRKTEAIIGGFDARPGSFQYQISLQVNNKHICGGAIVDKMFIITAAHCVIDDNELFIDRVYSIVAGVTKLKDDSGKIVIAVSKIYVPKEYRRTSPYTNYGNYYSPGDIAVLKLEQELPLGEASSLTKLIYPPQTANGNHLRYANLYATISGFGIENLINREERSRRIMEFSTELCNKLKYSKTYIMHKSTCKKAYPSITDKQICASLQQPHLMIPQGVCDGDSGSPLVLAEDNTFIGILMNTTTNCNEIKQPALYTRVSSYISFIEDAQNNIKSTDIRSAVYVRSSKSNQMKLTEIFQLL